MKANIKLLRKQRRYSPEFKKQVVKEFESGKLSVPQLSKLHGMSTTSIYRWIYKFSNFNESGFRIIEMAKSSTTKLQEMEQRIKKLEQIVGQKQIMIDYLETMIQVAQDELGYDIKKNFDTLQSKESRKENK